MESLGLLLLNNIDVILSPNCFRLSLFLQSFIAEFFSFCIFNWKGNPEKGVMEILKSIFSATCSSSWYAYILT